MIFEVRDTYKNNYLHICIYIYMYVCMNLLDFCLSALLSYQSLPKICACLFSEDFCFVLLITTENSLCTRNEANLAIERTNHKCFSFCFCYIIWIYTLIHPHTKVILHCYNIELSDFYNYFQQYSYFSINETKKKACDPDGNWIWLIDIAKRVLRSLNWTLLCKPKKLCKISLYYINDYIFLAIQISIKISIVHRFFF
jgi:hypothetical protein